MGFREHLEGMIEGVEGAVVASVVGLDGISVDTVEAPTSGEAADIDVQAMLVEYSSVLVQLRKAADVLRSGAVTELSVNSEHVITVARLLSDEYFAVLAVAPKANYGKARYVLRVTAPRLAKEL